MEKSNDVLAGIRIDRKKCQRPINQRLEVMRQEWKFSYLDWAMQLNDGTTDKQLQKHFANDSSNSLTIAKLCKLHHLPFWEPSVIFDGSVLEMILSEMKARGWTQKIFAYKMFTYNKDIANNVNNNETIEEWTNKIYKFFGDKSTDGFKLSLAREVLNKPSIRSRDWLTKSDYMAEYLDKKNGNGSAN